MESPLFGKSSRLGFELSPRRNPGFSVSRSVLVKAAVLGRSITYLKRFSPRENLKLEALRQMKGQFSEIHALLIAGGPSSSTVDTDLIERLQSAGILHVFGINRFFESRLGSLTQPDFYVLSDPAHGPNGHFSHWRQAVFERYPRTKLFLPSHWRYENESKIESGSQIIRFENRSLEGIGRGTSPLKLRRYLSLTALSAMSLSAYLGYRKVGIVGLDATAIFTAQVDQKNRISLGSNHHEGSGFSERVLVSRLPRADGRYSGNYRNASDLFFGEATLHDHLDRFFAPLDTFVNLSEASVVTSFPREPASVFLGNLLDSSCPPD